MGTKPTYRPHMLGGITRIRKDGAAITIRPAYDGGYRVVIGRNPGDGIFHTTHSRHFPDVRL